MKDNIKNLYFTLMKETGERVCPLLDRYLSYQWNSIPHLHNEILYFSNRRLKSKFLLKPFLVRLSYEAVGGKNWQEIVPVATAMELINISSYQANSVLDNKYGILSKPQKDGQIIASMITRELAENVINDTMQDSPLTVKLISLLSKANLYIYIGQEYEIKLLHVNNLDIDALHIDDYLNNVYLKKCDYISGIFTMCAALSGAIVASDNRDYLRRIKNFGRLFGIGLNIVNDLSDYIPFEKGKLPPYKSPSDTFSDVKGGRVFLPVFYALKTGNEKDRETIMKILDGRYDNKQLLELPDILVRSGGFGFAFSVAKQFMKKAKKELQRLPDSQSKKLLSLMASSIRSNKFIWTLRKYGMKTVTCNPYWKWEEYYE